MSHAAAIFIDKLQYIAIKYWCNIIAIIFLQYIVPKVRSESTDGPELYRHLYLQHDREGRPRRPCPSAVHSATNRTPTPLE